ncbi:succinate dehydrogenase cytochrome b subunit [Flavobacterium poyangense]|uniref:succinate dehydrogenase cytochrome b subunit n=1 Tax=Flavobacterium poyangense TaxID=2204302 RepID=UPI00141E4E3B|nr:succinate dehydrogenase cytochrome b subunit [Flavobacterium sp. JXAS1]
MNTLTRKVIMCLTGLFLCFFLIIHFLGNLQLFLPAEEAQKSFNAYSHFLSGNPLIKMISYGLYACILVHAGDAFYSTLQNKKTAGVFKTDHRGRASKWYSRNMGILGFVILLFLVLHFQNFWYYYKFGALPLDNSGNKDLYTLVVTSFQQWWIVLIYVVSMLALFYHLVQGVHSATRTLGLYHPKYVRWIQKAGLFYAVIICLGFASMPIYIYFTY